MYKNVTRESLFVGTSSTILSLIDLISSKFQNSLPAGMIGNIIASIVTSQPILLQVYLGVLVHVKKLIKHFFDYWLTSSYEEARRFKISAAVAKREKEKKRTSIGLNAKDGLKEAVADSFDAEIHYLNGLQQIHG